MSHQCPNIFSHQVSHSYWPQASVNQPIDMLMDRGLSRVVCAKQNVRERKREKIVRHTLLVTWIISVSHSVIQYMSIQPYCHSHSYLVNGSRNYSFSCTVTVYIFWQKLYYSAPPFYCNITPCMILVYTALWSTGTRTTSIVYKHTIDT